MHNGEWIEYDNRHTLTHAQTHAHTHARTDTRARTHARTHTHTHTHAYTHTYLICMWIRYICLFINGVLINSYVNILLDANHIALYLKERGDCLVRVVFWYLKGFDSIFLFFFGMGMALKEVERWGENMELSSCVLCARLVGAS